MFKNFEVDEACTHQWLDRLSQETKYDQAICKKLPCLAANSWDPAFPAVRGIELPGRIWKDVQVTSEALVYATELDFVLLKLDQKH